MSVVSAIIGTAERVPLPDVVIRAAIQRLCSRTATRLSALSAADDAAFAGRMMLRPIAEDADAGHDEVPASFFAKVLGPNRKYSSCFYKTDATTLQEAEEEALRQTVEHAGSRRRPDHPRARLRLGLAVAVDGAAVSAREGDGGVELAVAARLYRGGGAAARAPQSARRHRRHERVRARGPVRPHRLGRDVRAHDELAQADDARAIMARAGGALLHAHRHPSLRLPSVRPRQSRGLDRAALLHGRADAEPSPRQAIRRHLRRSRRNGAGAARIISAPQTTGSPISTRIATRSKRPCATSMARRPPCGCGAGAGSSSRPRACSATPTEPSGASATTG